MDVTERQQHEEEEKEHAERRTGEDWEREFGHCFPDLLEGLHEAELEKCRTNETAKLHDALSPIAMSTPRERTRPKFFDCGTDGASDRDRIVQKDRHRIRISETPDDDSSVADEEDTTNKCDRRPEAAMLHDALSPKATSTPRERKPTKFFDCSTDGANDSTRKLKDQHGKKRLNNPMQATSPSSDDEQRTFKRMRREPAESPPAKSPPAKSPPAEPPQPAVNKHPSQ